MNKKILRVRTRLHLSSIFVFLTSLSLTTFSYAQPSITIGSKIDTESILLCQMVGVALDHHGIAIKDKCGTGVTQVVRKALIQGEIDLYPEYTGNAPYLIDHFKFNTKIPELMYQQIAQSDLKNNQIVWLKPAPANNTFVIAVTQRFSKQQKVKTLDDFARYIRSGQPTKLIASYEFVTRADGLKAFESKYNFKLKNHQLIMIPGGNTAQTENALARGANGINASMAYGTDGQLAALNLIGLIDTQGAQETYHPAITIRAAVLKSNPKIKPIIEQVFSKLTTKVLSQLNAQVVVNGRNPKVVATEYLQKSGGLP